MLRPLRRHRWLAYAIGILLVVGLVGRFLPRRPPSAGDLPDGCYRVLEVLDGDTIVVEGGLRIRFVSIDAPEMNYHRGRPEPFAREAKGLVERLIEEAGGRVLLVRCRRQTDRYGRYLRHAYVMVNGKKIFVEEELVRSGLARARDYGDGCPHLSILYAAEKEARRRKAGLWSTKNQGGEPLSAPPAWQRHKDSWGGN